MGMNLHEGKNETYKDINTLSLRQNGRHFPDNIFKRVFLNEKL